MTVLSVNLNKVALIRNSRDTSIPDVVEAAKTCIEAGCSGITVHPRPDQRHIRVDDVYRLAEFLSDYPEIEFNIEGNPEAGPEPNGYPGFLALIEAVKPAQCTLVPDDPRQLTSDHGWDIQRDAAKLTGYAQQLHNWGSRVSVFLDADPAQLQQAPMTGIDRIELYTGPYAAAASRDQGNAAIKPFAETAQLAAALGIGVNAGHDLNLDNLAAFKRGIPNLLEVSIGHALVTDALWMGLDRAVKRYLQCLE
ncbi:MAG: pyridoxine 5'-phosphate synthase [Pseudomonadales bacterium]